jgi:hypothetical protein
LEVELNDEERRAVGRLLTERKARLIEITEDTTQTDRARRTGLVGLLTIGLIIGKLCCVRKRVRAKKLARTFKVSKKRSNKAA